MNENIRCFHTNDFEYDPYEKGTPISYVINSYEYDRKSK